MSKDIYKKGSSMKYEDSVSTVRSNRYECYGEFGERIGSLNILKVFVSNPTEISTVQDFKQEFQDHIEDMQLRVLCKEDSDIFILAYEDDVASLRGELRSFCFPPEHYASIKIN